MPKSKQDVNKAVPVALVISVMLAIDFLYGLLQLLQNMKINAIVGSPSIYAAVPGIALATYAFVKADNNNQRYVAIVVLTMLATGMLVWLFGTTAAGSSLVTRIPS